ncbi:hypothetical protein BU183_19375, partial [Enterococcus faecium]
FLLLFRNIFLMFSILCFQLSDNS